MGEQTETRALLQLLALGQKEIDEGRFIDALPFLDELDESEDAEQHAPSQDQ